MKLYITGMNKTKLTMFVKEYVNGQKSLPSRERIATVENAGRKKLEAGAMALDLHDEVTGRQTVADKLAEMH